MTCRASERRGRRGPGTAGRQGPGAADVRGHQGGRRGPGTADVRVRPDTRRRGWPGILVTTGEAGLTRSNAAVRLAAQEDDVADAPVSIREVAALAGVSVGTVS